MGNRRTPALVREFRCQIDHVGCPQAFHESKEALLLRQPLLGLSESRPEIGLNAHRARASFRLAVTALIKAKDAETDFRQPGARALRARSDSRHSHENAPPFQRDEAPSQDQPPMQRCAIFTPEKEILHPQAGIIGRPIVCRVVRAIELRSDRLTHKERQTNQESPESKHRTHFRTIPHHQDAAAQIWGPNPQSHLSHERQRNSIGIAGHELSPMRFLASHAATANLAKPGNVASHSYERPANPRRVPAGLRIGGTHIRRRRK